VQALPLAAHTSEHMGPAFAPRQIGEADDDDFLDSDMEGIGYQEYAMGQILSPLPRHLDPWDKLFSENDELIDDDFVDDSFKGEHSDNSLDTAATGNSDTTFETQAFVGPPSEVGLNPSHSQHNREVCSRTEEIDPLPSEDDFIDDMDLEDGLIEPRDTHRGRSPWSIMDEGSMLAGGVSYDQGLLRGGHSSARTPLETPKLERSEQRREVAAGSPYGDPTTSHGHILYDGQAHLERTPRSYPPATLQEAEDHILDD
jgi:hypothetical protein